MLIAAVPVFELCFSVNTENTGELFWNRLRIMSTSFAFLSDSQRYSKTSCIGCNTIHGSGFQCNFNHLPNVLSMEMTVIPT